MNVGGINIPFVIQNHSKEMKGHRYEGYFYGAGISAGHHWILSSRFSVEASLGVGYARVKYDRFRCTSCGKGPVREKLIIWDLQSLQFR